MCNLGKKTLGTVSYKPQELVKINIVLSEAVGVRTPRMKPPLPLSGILPASGNSFLQQSYQFLWEGSRNSVEADSFSATFPF